MSLFSTFRMILSSISKPQQSLSVLEIPNGLVIDIGGGGEGVIAQIGKSDIVVIDRFLSEIQEARAKSPESNWMVADATGLPYRDHSFDHATAFFSCMYMPEAVKEKVFRETQRVLRPGGEFWIWDVNMNANKKVFAIRLKVILPHDRLVQTAYGVKAKDQSAESIRQQLQASGYDAVIVSNQKHWFLIKARTKGAAMAA